MSVLSYKRAKYRTYSMSCDQNIEELNVECAVSHVIKLLNIEHAVHLVTRI